MAVFGRLRMPSLGGATGWLNSEPLGSAELRGRVVLVNFWTLTCINWLRQEAYVRAWSQAYWDDGLIVIGVHTPEFSFEQEIDRVRQATEDRVIDYPVALDSDYAIWSAFDNHYWPALYFVDTGGGIRDQHFGEGRYEQSERVIQELFGIERELAAVEGVGVEAEADWGPTAHPRDLSRLRTRQWPRVTERTVTRRTASLRAPREPGLQQLGPCRRVDDRARAGRARRSRGQHRLPLPRARRASRALTRRARGDPFRVLLDGEAPGLSHGVDVDEDGNGLLREGRLYQLVRQHDGVGERTLEIEFLESGAEAYAFTFG